MGTGRQRAYEIVGEELMRALVAVGQADKALRQPGPVVDRRRSADEGLSQRGIDALELVVLVEEKFNIQIPDEDVGKRAFASIDALTEYVSEELSKSP